MNRLGKRRTSSQHWRLSHKSTDMTFKWVGANTPSVGVKDSGKEKTKHGGVRCLLCLSFREKTCRSEQKITVFSHLLFSLGYIYTFEPFSVYTVTNVYTYVWKPRNKELTSSSLPIFEVMKILNLFPILLLLSLCCYFTLRLYYFYKKEKNKMKNL